MSEVEWLDIFAGNLIAIMEETGYSQAALAKESGISQGTISKYIRKKQIPSIKAIVNISYVLNCDIRDLIDFGDMVE